MDALFKFLQGAAQIFILLFDVATLRKQGCHDKKRINDTTDGYQYLAEMTS